MENFAPALFKAWRCFQLTAVKRRTMERTINLCPLIGASAHIIQHTELLFPSTYFEQPHLYQVQQRVKRMRWLRREVVAHAGEMLIIDGDQTVKIISNSSEEGLFNCQLLTCDPLLLAAQPPLEASLTTVPLDPVLALRNLPFALMHSFAITSLALTLKQLFPAIIMRHKMLKSYSNWNNTAFVSLEMKPGI